MADKKYTYAVGRRKTAVAQVRLFQGKGDSTINERKFDEYITRPDLFAKLMAPLKLVGLSDKIHFEVKVKGSGINAQVDAIVHGLARAIVKDNEDHKRALRDAGFLTRDARKVERKKPGLHKARKAIQWSKR